MCVCVCVCVCVCCILLPLLSGQIANVSCLTSKCEMGTDVWGKGYASTEHRSVSTVNSIMIMILSKGNEFGGFKLAVWRSQ